MRPKIFFRVLFVCYQPHHWVGNARALAESLVSDGLYVTILCTPKARTSVEAWARNFPARRAPKIASFSGSGNLSKMKFLMELALTSVMIQTATLVVTTHGWAKGKLWNSALGKNLVLWHGTPAKAIWGPNLPVPKFWVSSGPWETKYISRPEIGLSKTEILSIGYPRWRYMEDIKLPADLETLDKRLQREKRGKKVALLALTYEGIDVFGHSLRALIQDLSEALESNGFLLAIRFHPNNILFGEHKPFEELFGDHVLNWSLPDTHETGIALRNTDLLITDFSSIWVDYLRLSRPMVMLRWRGFPKTLSPLASLFPGIVVRDTDELAGLFRKARKGSPVFGVSAQQEKSYESSARELFGSEKNSSKDSFVSKIRGLR